MKVKILIKLKSELATLKHSNKKVAKYIIDNPKEVMQLPIKKLSNEMNVSEATLIRFCKKIGFKGFLDFKNQLSEELLNENKNIKEITNKDIFIDDNLVDIKEKTQNFINTSLVETKNFMNVENLTTIIEMLESKNRFLFIGVGASGFSALEGSAKFNRIGFDSDCYIDLNTMLLKINSIPKTSIVIAFSHSGISRETLEVARMAKDKGLTLLVVTHSYNSPLAKLGDYTILNGSEGEKFHGDSIGTRVSQLYVIDIIYNELLKRKFKENPEKGLKLKNILNTVK